MRPRQHFAALDYPICFCLYARTRWRNSGHISVAAASSRRINGHYTLIPRVDRISPPIAKVSMCRGWCFHIDQLKLLAVCLDRCYVYNGHFGFEPQRYEEYTQRSQILISNAGAADLLYHKYPLICNICNSVNILRNAIFFGRKWRARKERHGLILEGAYIKSIERRRLVSTSRVAPSRLAHGYAFARLRTRLCVHVGMREQKFVLLLEGSKSSSKTYKTQPGIFRRQTRSIREDEWDIRGRGPSPWQNSISKSLPRRFGRYRWHVPPQDSRQEPSRPQFTAIVENDIRNRLI